MDVGKWEEENERRFLINGCHYMDIITNQWAAFNAQKEQEILERVRNYLGLISAISRAQELFYYRKNLGKISINITLDVHCTCLLFFSL